MITAFSPEELEAQLGQHIKSLRLLKNLDQLTVCDQAGISLNALKHLESGSGANIKTLIKVIRVLGKVEWLLTIAPQITVNPMTSVRGKPKRQRATGTRGKSE